MSHGQTHLELGRPWSLFAGEKTVFPPGWKGLPGAWNRGCNNQWLFGHWPDKHLSLGTRRRLLPFWNTNDHDRLAVRAGDDGPGSNGLDRLLGSGTRRWWGDGQGRDVDLVSVCGKELLLRAGGSYGKGRLDLCSFNVILTVEKDRGGGRRRLHWAALRCVREMDLRSPGGGGLKRLVTGNAGEPGLERWIEIDPDGYWLPGHSGQRLTWNDLKGTRRCILKGRSRTE